MNDFNYWNPYFEDNKYPCYVRDIASEEIIYANKEFFKVFDCDESILGEKFHKVIRLYDGSYANIKDFINKGQDYEFGFYHKKTQQYYQGDAHLIRDNRSVFCRCKILLDDSDSRLEKALARCTEIYQMAPQKVVKSLMELLCEFYHAGRAYVHRFDYENKSINCISQWYTNLEVSSSQAEFSKENAALTMEWANTERKQGLLVADFTEQKYRNTRIARAFATINTHNALIYTIEDLNQNVIGVVGVSNLESSLDEVDNRLLSTVARFVSQDVNKGVLDAQLVELHNRDTLTGLYNRVGYAKKVDQILEFKPKSMGVISANVNGLKYINESSGIVAGDNHIKKAAKTLKKHFDFEIFRMSGDEFIGLAPNISREDFEEKVNSLHSRLREEDNYDFSFGHAWGSGNINLPKLTFEAETIMYINKQEYYTHSDRKFNAVTDNILSDLLRFLQNDEFMIYLQPQVCLKDGKLYGAEALIRRFDKENEKMVFPDQFIPLYEQKSVIRHVDLFVVNRVCQLLKDWGKMGRAIPISVNLSRVTLQEYGIVNSIVEICDKYQVPHNLLVIEVTERVGLIENNVASALIKDFKNQGFNISLDDFGCAYSNIVTLAQIQVDEVKIDKSLVDNLTTNKNNHILVKNVLTMCNELEGASTLAEGIEEGEQAKVLYELGCHLGQGYYYSRPIPVPDFYEEYVGLK